MKIEGDLQHAMLEHLCNFQVILYIFNKTINIFRSCIFECICSPVWVITTFPSLLTIENTLPFIITLLALWKNDALSRMISLTSFPLTRTRRLKPFRDIGILRLDVCEPEPYPTDNSYRQSVSIRYAKYRQPHCYLLPEMHLHRINSKQHRVNRRKFTGTLSNFAIYLNSSRSESNWF